MKEPVYGVFPGGDPRDFSPDPEASTEKELALHKEHCAAWDRGERPTVPVSGFVGTTHFLRAHYGLGVYYVDMDEEFEDEA